jgi:hypothetical protein
MVPHRERSLRTWERKVLRKIYGPVYDNGIWRIRTNKELMALYQELEIVAEIKKARLRWLGHVERMSEYRVIKKLYMSKPEGRRSVGRPKVRWLDDVEEDLRKMRISGWRGKARRRDEWKSVLREVKDRSAIRYRYCFAKFFRLFINTFTLSPMVCSVLIIIFTPAKS